MIYDWCSSACSKYNFDNNPQFMYHYYVATGKDAENIRADWQKENFQSDMKQELESWHLDAFLQENIFENNINLSVLPENSFVIQFKVILKKPYISIDEQDFYIIDNPIRKDKVFSLPYVAPSSWKGSLRSALYHLGCNSEDKRIQSIIGGNTLENDEILTKGRIHLFPSFFKKKGLEIINPHNRETRVGTIPIPFECVPVGESGLFTLLYVPYNQFLNSNTKEFKNQILDDLLLLSQGLQFMFLTYGFGAKTPSGFGIVEDKLIDGKITLKTKSITVSMQIEVKPPEKVFEKYLKEDGKVKDAFIGGGEDGLLSNKEYNQKTSQFKDGSLNEFKRFRTWYKFHGSDWQKHLQSENETSAKWPFWNFGTFDELINAAIEIKQKLSEGEGQ
ncbi:RAMP superfamily CRISPR-associated protein [Methanomethylovorans sp.]|uniref:RAMP superfamily CRISPR-associated protein n=1 Tax=Methanomethylovorans sp. TaxID=2758717 RepID=UPI000A91D64F|nr:RAMP superfamily CRISPR-associated protein [Methanomethylovorans sp.]